MSVFHKNHEAQCFPIYIQSFFQIQTKRGNFMTRKYGMWEIAVSGKTAGNPFMDYQIFADRTIHFDDCEQARNAVIELEGTL